MAVSRASTSIILMDKLGVTLDPSARYLLCSASASTVSFSVFGVENS